MKGLYYQNTGVFIFGILKSCLSFRDNDTNIQTSILKKQIYFNLFLGH